MTSVPFLDVPFFDVTAPTTVVTLSLCAIAYLLGSIPFGVILTRLAGLGDIRAIGSGNIGATNVLRTGNKALAFMTLWLDYGKGALAVWLGSLISPDSGLIAGACVFFGHIFPVWLSFRGGKGVATFFGIVMAINWVAGLSGMTLWLVLVLATRISSLAALISALVTPIFLFLLGAERAAIFAALLVVILVVRHRANIERLMAGTEPKIGMPK